MKHVLKIALLCIIGLSIILAGCSSPIDNPIIEEDETINNESTPTQGDPINETFEENTVDEDDDVEIGEII